MGAASHALEQVATVWKFEWPKEFLSGVADIDMPRGAEVLHAEAQHGKVCIWARVDPTETVFVPRKFALCLTGGGAPNAGSGRFVATLLLDSGAFVVHLFEQP